MDLLLIFIFEYGENFIDAGPIITMQFVKATTVAAVTVPQIILRLQSRRIDQQREEETLRRMQQNEARRLSTMDTGFVALPSAAVQTWENADGKMWFHHNGYAYEVTRIEYGTEVLPKCVPSEDLRIGSAR